MEIGLSPEVRYGLPNSVTNIFSLTIDAY